MATKLFCDRCLGEITKGSNKMLANTRKFEICNICWHAFLIYMGRPFYTVESLPDRTKEIKNK